MDKKVEKEYKILLTKEQFDKLAQYYEPLHYVEQTNVYYDTSEHHIQQIYGAMRIRSSNGKHIFTLKLHEDGKLMEYECEVDSNSLAALQTENIQQLLKDHAIDGELVQTASLQTHRAMVVDEYAELCFDINKYNGIVDYEIEYEYKKDHDGRTRFNAILDKVGLHYEKNCKAKIARALNR